MLRRNTPADAAMFAAVAPASPGTISCVRIANSATIPVMMTINHEMPVILAA